MTVQILISPDGVLSLTAAELCEFDITLQAASVQLALALSAELRTVHVSWGSAQLCCMLCRSTSRLHSVIL